MRNVHRILQMTVLAMALAAPSCRVPEQASSTVAEPNRTRAGETDSITEQFQTWARDHASSFDAGSLNVSLPDAKLQQLTPLRGIVDDARVVALGEPFHGGHEALAIRNVLCRYLVTELGFTAIALETGVAPSKRLYDYVLLKRQETDSALAEAFSYGFGAFKENLELLHWMRRYNSEQPPSRRVRLYGVDMTGQVFPNAYRSLDALLPYLDGADRTLAARVRSDFADVIGDFRIDKFHLLPNDDQLRIQMKTDDLITILRNRRNDLTAATSRDDYDWALRQAVSAGQDAGYMRLAPREWVELVGAPGEPPKAGAPLPSREALHKIMEVRETSMADNLAWVLEREGRQGRVVFFAHNYHVKGRAWDVQGNNLWSGIQPAGQYLRSMLEHDLVTIGIHFGNGMMFPNDARRLDPVGTLDALLSSRGVPTYIFDLRALPVGGPLAGWFEREQSTQDLDYDDKRSVSRVILQPSRAYDAIVYIDRITPARQ